MQRGIRMNRSQPLFAAIVLMVGSFAPHVQAELPQPTLTPLHVTADLNLGESQEVTLTNGKKVTLKVLDLAEQRDSLRGAVRKAEVKVLVDGKEVTLVSANYRLPVTVGEVQIDCPVTSGYTQQRRRRPAGSILGGWRRMPACGSGRPVRPGSIPGHFSIRRSSAGSPATRRWPTSRSTSTAARSRGRSEHLLPLRPRYRRRRGAGRRGRRDRRPGRLGRQGSPAGLRGHAGLAALRRGLPARRPRLVLSLQPPAHDRAGHSSRAARSSCGQTLGLLGKEGGSGGWSHLHFDISGRQPSGKWGIIDGYAFLWEAYLREHKPQAARRRPAAPLRRRGRKGDARRQPFVVGRGSIASYEWTLHRRHRRQDADGRADATPSRASTARS